MTDKERTAAIAFLSNLIDHDAEAWGCAQEIPIFKTALEALTSDGWVPCSERLPKEEKQYEVTIRRKHESFNRVGARHFVKPSYSARGVWLDSSLCETVLAWRDMPKPWKGEE